MKLALWQTAPTDGRIEQAFNALSAQLKAAAAAGATLLVAPELFLPGYDRPDLHRDLAQPRDGDWMKRLSEMARETACGICLGWAERDGEAVYNAATLIGPDGEVLSHYRKIQLYGPMEAQSFQRGDQLGPVVKLAEWPVATLVCYDIEFPGHAAALAAAGTRLILVPTANPLGYEHVQRLLVPARAHENRAVVAYANYYGAEGNTVFGGLSVIAGPDGQPLATAGARGEALLIVDLAAVDAIPADNWSALAQEYRDVTQS
ncbi:nitrilase-related carbon-nitrogen hydrolase [Paracoccus xiamenensis]|uniref:nitrilase-related carbon-nitrogen hydrolase n=1 Tax=Paracoccus xiamenensis TaxID=2714901 RepID=UPI001407E7BE|nr:nitrilase-related carbon-nitrogen hydrolase [Paracoccus xiamenensis]NHF73166.1 nitrilase [Paracoccus xiamenensis]